MIKVTFEEGIDNITSEVGLFQWDTGQPFEIHGVTDLEVAPKVHFATKMTDTAYVVQGELTNGVISCIIPDIVVTHGFPVLAFIYYEQGLDKKTIRTITIPVTKRAKPNGWVETKPSDIQYVRNFLEMLRNDFEDFEDEYYTFKTYVNGLFTSYNVPKIREDLDAVTDRVNNMQVGMQNKTIVFNDDGSIVETTVDSTTTTVFHDDGHITETIVKDGTTVVRNTYFDEDGTIREVIS